jgi:hypothetical protein
MPGSRVWWLFSAGLISFTFAGSASVRAQTPSLPVPGVVVRPSSVTSQPMPGNPSPSGPPMVLEQPAAMPAAGGTAVVPLPAAGNRANPPAHGCSCGERVGVSRWWWHKTHCKRKLQEWALGFPEEFNEWPLGSSLYAHGRTQVANGNAARMVFYRYDFIDHTSQLNTRGRDKLAKISQLLPSTFCPVVVERTPATPGLDEERRATLLGELSGSNFPVPPERIVIGPPIAAGLTGPEAVLLYGSQLSALQQRGAIGAGGYSGAAGFDASGLSGSAITAVPGAGGGSGR